MTRWPPRTDRPHYRYTKLSRRRSTADKARVPTAVAVFNRPGVQCARKSKRVQRYLKSRTPVTWEEIGRFTSCSLSRQLTRVEPCCTPTYRERAGRNTAAWETTVAADGLKDHWCVLRSSPGCEPRPVVQDCTHAQHDQRRGRVTDG